MPQPTISRILNGASEDPRTITLDALARYFGLSASDLRTPTPTRRTKRPVSRLFNTFQWLLTRNESFSSGVAPWSARLLPEPTDPTMTSLSLKLTAGGIGRAHV